MGAFGAIFRGLMNDLKSLNSAKMNNYLKNLGTIIKTSPQEVKIAYYCVFAGFFMVIVQLFLWIVF